MYTLYDEMPFFLPIPPTQLLLLPTNLFPTLYSLYLIHTCPVHGITLSWW